MARHRNPNGDPRPYKDGDRWVLRLEHRMPDGRIIKCAGTSQKRAECVERAKANLARNIEKARQEKHAGSAASSVDTWLAHWMNSKSNLKPRTRIGYQAAIDHRILPAIGTKALYAVTLEDIEQIHAQILLDGCSRTIWGTVKTVLRQSFDEAARRGHIDRSPMTFAPALQPKKRSEQWLTAEQARSIIEATPTLWGKARWTLALTIGLRQGEALGLRWCDLDLDGQHPVMVVNKSLGRFTGQGLVYGETKTSQRRDLPIPSPLLELLKKHRREQRAVFLSLGIAWSDMTPLFVAFSADGVPGPIDPSNDRKHWLRALERAGVARVRLHDARHTAATIMLMAGADMYSVSKALGHSSIQTTIDTYGHLPTASLRSALEASTLACASAAL